MIDAKITDMIGKVFDSIGISQDKTEILFVCDEGLYKMYHEQSCCEYVVIESIVGNMDDLLYVKLMGAEEIINVGEPEDHQSSTYTFYKFRTTKGYVDIRWIGTSNGYYSEGVSFVKV